MEKQHSRNHQHVRSPLEQARQFGGHYYYDANHNPLSENKSSLDDLQYAYQTNSGASTQAISPYQMYAKPPQPEEWIGQMSGAPMQAPTKKPNPIMTHFYDEQGKMDIQKMLSTVNQLASTVKQVSPVIQQLGSIVRLVR